MTEPLTVYVEGGGDRPDLRTRCRRAFAKFFQKAGCAGVRVVACGSGHQAYQCYREALGKGGQPLLLLDAEGPLPRPGKDGPTPSWELLARLKKHSKKSRRPEHARDDDLHFMVQCMEAWFLADHDAIVQVFPGARPDKLPQRPQVEEVPKAHVLEGLKEATRNVRKGPYRKGRLAFDVLERIDPDRARVRAPWLDRLLRRLAG